jgi:hypothetical protein
MPQDFEQGHTAIAPSGPAFGTGVRGSILSGFKIFAWNALAQIPEGLAVVHFIFTKRPVFAGIAAAVLDGAGGVRVVVAPSGTGTRRGESGCPTVAGSEVVEDRPIIASSARIAPRRGPDC